MQALTAQLHWSARLLEDALEGSVKEGWLLCQRVRQPFGDQPFALQHARYAGQRVWRHRSAAGCQREQVAQEQLLPNQLPVLIAELYQAGLSAIRSIRSAACPCISVSGPWAVLRIRGGTYVAIEACQFSKVRTQQRQDNGNQQPYPHPHICAGTWAARRVCCAPAT